MQTVYALYFDGLSTRQQQVALLMHDGLLELQADGLYREIPLSQVNISSKLGSTPRLLHFAEGGHCEIKDHAAFDAMLEQVALPTHSALTFMEGSWRHALLATLLAIAFVIASFYWGLSRFADFVSERVPRELSLSIDQHFLQVFEQGLMQTSTLDPQRQDALRRQLNQLSVDQDVPVYQLVFRSSKNIGANAFALPGGTIIATDQLVELARNDEEIIAVLAHELGHVSERHPLRQILQSSVIGLAMTWYFGDISSLLVLAPTLLLETNYSRHFERRADVYAATLLQTNKISPARLADILEKLESSHREKKEKIEPTSSFLTLFSTHPDTQERIQYLRNFNAP